MCCVTSSKPLPLSGGLAAVGALPGVTPALRLFSLETTPSPAWLEAEPPGSAMGTGQGGLDHKGRDVT